jgi:hypothetical protein
VRVSFLILVLLALGLLAPGEAAAHGMMTVPASRALGSENEDYQYCLGKPDCHCDEFPDPGPIVATWEAGATIEVTIDVTLSHDTGTTFRFQLCPAESQSDACFASGEFAAVAFDQTTGPRSYEITLPADLVCDPCVLRWKWDYGFLSCADVRIVASGTPVDSRGWTALKSTFR